ncbi:MAG: toluene tolerance protein [Pseudomonas sp.]
MQPLDHSAYLSLRDGATVLEADRYGDKVLRLVDGNFLKLFRRKRLLTSAALFPYAQRFADNAKALQLRGIPCPQVLGVYRAPSIQRDLVHYAPLPGQTLRQLLDERGNAEALREQLGRFVALLHESGIYFRSLHLGNIVLTPESALGLIDIADLRTQRLKLGKRLRLRNFRHMLRYPEDRDWLLSEGGTTFLNSYLQHASIRLNSLALRHKLNLH